MKVFKDIPTITRLQYEYIKAKEQYLDGIAFKQENGITYIGEVKLFYDCQKCHGNGCDICGGTGKGPHEVLVDHRKLKAT